MSMLVRPRARARLPRLACRARCSQPEEEHSWSAERAAEAALNVQRRKGAGDPGAALELHRALHAAPPPEPARAAALRRALHRELLRLPNATHPAVALYGDTPRLLRLLNSRGAGEGALQLGELTRRLNIMRTDQLGATCGPRAYYLCGELAELEEALMRFTVRGLLARGFRAVSVPDVLPARVLQSCGMTPDGDRTQVYSLDPVHHGPDLCLSGTAEMSLAGLLQGKRYEERELPHKMVAVSRCYRAETSNVVEQRGIYRVHQFTKVEMFAVTSQDKSDEMLEHLRETQEELFTPLGIHMQVLDMPPKELGAPAYRKYDIEAWMPGRGTFGEISSCSNCTDYQSRRLDIKYTRETDGRVEFVHTLNGTACAVPRMLIALLETHQQKNCISIPKALRPFMAQKETITKKKNVPELKLLKIKS